ncbi:MAG: UDP-N-acetylmuramoyl-L-alanine--D-glutamate ligase [Lachnospiraceae bacterium]|jgi:UDP-N-acetylmuramoylalanine--D-glutamate ligase|nr:UDP-N-acetylmuramoyl-L-alanine--D-glutamate ligase [Lachnospiraceae bacterium]
MLDKLLNYLSDKKILILGFGLEGVSTYKFLRKNFSQMNITIVDIKENFDCDNKELKEDSFAQCIYGNTYLEHLQEYDLILKSPGVSLKDVDISGFEDKIKSQLELLLEFVDVFTIGITGTKGKSTTSSLTYEVLKEQNKDVKLLGNIGVPVFEKIDEINENTVLVLELSSHMLEFAKKAPNIAILLNIYEEHLDYYKTLNDYINAKMNIVKYQTEKDVAILNIDNEIIKNNVSTCRADVIKISINSGVDADFYIEDGYIWGNGVKLYDITQNRNLLGNHNLNNIMFVLAVSNIMDLNIEKTIETINTFKGLEHRMEYVGEVDGVKYYNDSIATIPESTICTLEAIENVDTLIVGGKDRGVDLEGLIEYIEKSSIKNVICMPKTGEYIEKGIKKDGKEIVLVNTLEEAVYKAKQLTEKGKTCVLSPAASSYGYFKNFEERGRLFKQYVMN